MDETILGLVDYINAVASFVGLRCFLASHTWYRITNHKSQITKRFCHRPSQRDFSKLITLRHVSVTGSPPAIQSHKTLGSSRQALFTKKFCMTTFDTTSRTKQKSYCPLGFLEC
jgi:hypothetical protein